MQTDNQLTSPILQKVNPVNIKSLTNGWRIPCPIHNGTDLNFHLHLNEAGSCYSQCSKYFSKKEIYDHLEIPYHAEILTVDKFLEAFNFTNDDIERFEIKFNKDKGLVFPYYDMNKVHQGSKYRKRLDQLPDKFHTTKKFNPILFGLQLLPEIKKHNYVLLVEGETDVISAWKRGIPALGISGVSNWKPSFIKDYQLDELKQVFVWYEKDEASKGLIQKIGKDLPACVVVDHEKYKDLSEMNREDESHDNFHQLLRDSQNKGVTAGSFLFEARNKRFIEITEDKEYGELINLKEKDFNQKLLDDIKSCGFGGNLAPVLAAILSINSKKLDKPFHLQLLAESGSGKSFTIDTSIKFFPEDQVHIMEASTPATFIYDETDISKKALYVKEIDSVPQGDSSIASALRNAMSHGILKYQTTVEDDNKGRRIVDNFREVKSVLTTGTRTPEIQTSTRLLLMDVDYSTDQIKINMQLQALRFAGYNQNKNPDVWKLFFEALDLKNPNDIEVEVPFAPKLYAAITNDKSYMDVRWNRDFSSLMAAIQSSAILHHRFREKISDFPNLKLVATLDDYEFVRDSLWRSFQVSQKQGVNESQMRILEKIKELNDQKVDVTQKILSEKMNVTQAYISKEVKKLKRFIEITNKPDDRRTKYLSVDLLPDSIMLPTRKEVEKAKLDSESEII